MGEFVTIARHDDRVATVRVDRAPVNALNQQVWSDLNEAAGILSDDCLRMGLVDRVVDAEDVYDTAMAAARHFAAGPHALRLAKQAIGLGVDLPLDAALELEAELFSSCFTTEDARIGMRSFLEQGPGQARFTGR